MPPVTPVLVGPLYGELYLGVGSAPNADDSASLVVGDGELALLLESMASCPPHCRELILRPDAGLRPLLSQEARAGSAMRVCCLCSHQPHPCCCCYSGTKCLRDWAMLF